MEHEVPYPRPLTKSGERRRFLKLAASLGGGLLAGCRSDKPELAPGVLGQPISAYGERSRFETVTRQVGKVPYPEAASSRTPIEQTYGIITPASLHFERHHAGVPHIDPAAHRLMIHGMVDRPLMLTMDELKRLPSVSRIHFIECAGNGRSEWGPETAPDCGAAVGLASCSEWTGVPLRLLLEEAGVQSGAAWVLAEGDDACKMQRSIPLAKCMDDAIVAYGQNGEALRPEQGYPVRLVLPGWEGNTSVKWLRRLKVSEGPHMVKDETSKYTDLMADGTARQFTFESDARSIVTYPSGGQRLAQPGHYEIAGLAWSGRGLVAKVEVSTDGGRTWREAELQAPVLPKAFTRFRLPWEWQGAETLIQSRCTDETGYVQPTVRELIAARGRSSDYHNNGIKTWKVWPDGRVTHVSA